MENNIREEVKSLVHESKAYINLRTRLLSLQLRKSAAELISSIGTSALLIVFASMSFLFASFGLAYYLADRYHSFSIGFLLVAVIYFMLLMVVLLFRNSLKKYISNTIIKELFKEETQDEN
jgi:hypothetical protein